MAEENLICGMVIGIFDTVLFQGQTVKEAKADFERAIDFFLEDYTGKGKPAPKPFSGNIQFRVSPEIHAAVCEVAEIRNMSFNKLGESILIEAIEKYKPEAIPVIGKVNARRSRIKKKLAAQVV